MNCKPGDLAFIIHVDLTECAGNVGAIVKVIEWHAVGNGWIVETCGRPLHGWCWIEDRLRVVQRVCVYDHHLRPIRGEPERVSTDEPITAEA